MVYLPNLFSRCEDPVLSSKENSQLSLATKSSPKDYVKIEESEEQDNLGILDIINRLEEVADTLISRLHELKHFMIYLIFLVVSEH